MQESVCLDEVMTPVGTHNGSGGNSEVVEMSISFPVFAQSSDTNALLSTVFFINSEVCRIGRHPPWI